MRIAYLTLIISLLTIATSCEKTLEDVEKKYKDNLKKVEIFQANHPDISGILEKRIVRAEKEYDQAQSINDEEKRIEEINKIANQLTSGFIHNLDRLDRDLSSLRRSIRELEEEIDDPYFGNRSVLLLSDANNKHSQYINYRRNFSADSESEANRKTKSWVNDVNTTERKLSKIIREYERYKRELKKDNNVSSPAKNTVDKNKTNSSKPTVSTVKCSYCKSTNDKSNKKCKKCGAPL